MTTICNNCGTSFPDEEPFCPRCGKPQLIIVAIEDDNAVIALLHQYGVRNIATINRFGTGKLYTTSGSAKSSEKSADTKKDFFNNILTQLQQARPENSPLIIVGPGFTKDEFVKFCREKHISDMDQVNMENTGQAGMVGVQEALRRGVVGRIAKESRLGFETELVNKVLEEISKDGKVGYGLMETKRAVEVGAVETLLVIDKLIRGKNDQVEQILEKTESTGGTINIISTVHDAGKQLEALGGIAALLRYKI